VKVGDLVKHKWGTISGLGIILNWHQDSETDKKNRAFMMWNCEGYVTYQSLPERFIEVVSESR